MAGHDYLLAAAVVMGLSIPVGVAIGGQRYLTTDVPELPVWSRC